MSSLVHLDHLIYIPATLLFQRFRRLVFFTCLYLPNLLAATPFRVDHSPPIRSPKPLPYNTDVLRNFLYLPPTRLCHFTCSFRLTVHIFSHVGIECDLRSKIFPNYERNKVLGFHSAHPFHFAW
ncbi:hypothetical protein DFP72DRAFT_561122 [Ephemerocybe angulata]|uniref:Uncharacterized protein n=1 Tax=Ephemerocybe angulata TaxID=980116 RepID=A0A8H6IE53_9AGAR|nr:hypothetical protein DFP72DRAFT_561122 [Tulosesus angulatus]